MIRLGQVRLKVRHLERSIQFYTNLLGLRATKRSHKDFAFLAFGAQRPLLALQGFRPEAGAAASEPVFVRVHLAFEASDREAFDGVRRRLEEAGVPTHAVSHRGKTSLHFDDPDGNGLELYLDRQKAFGPGWISWGATRPDRSVPAVHASARNVRRRSSG